MNALEELKAAQRISSELAFSEIEAATNYYNKMRSINFNEQVKQTLRDKMDSIGEMISGIHLVMVGIWIIIGGFLLFAVPLYFVETSYPLNGMDTGLLVFCKTIFAISVIVPCVWYALVALYKRKKSGIAKKLNLYEKYENVFSEEEIEEIFKCKNCLK